MKKIVKAISKPLESFFKSMDKIAAHVSIMPNRPERPPLTNSGPLIENKENMTFYK